MPRNHARGPAWSVPGKLMLAGEYAVLDGSCEALAVAVGELAVGRLGAPSERPILALEAFDRRWHAPLDQLPKRGIGGLIGAALAAVDARGWALGHDLELHFGGHLGGVKLGLGTSAAAVVAALRAGLLSTGRELTPEAFVATAGAVHRELQGGRGSGYDIATIAAGGCVAWHARTRRLARLAWPEGLVAAALFTGIAADTRAAIDRPPAAPRRAAMAAAATALRPCWERGQLEPILEGLAACQEAFAAAAHDQPELISPELRRGLAFIDDRGCVARVSGAGGGDCLLAFSDDPDKITVATAGWRGGGGHVVAELPRDLACDPARGRAPAP